MQSKEARKLKLWKDLNHKEKLVRFYEFFDTLAKAGIFSDLDRLEVMILERFAEWCDREDSIKRYWVSWWSTYMISKGCKEPPFQTWIMGTRWSNGGRFSDPEEQSSFCAVIDATSEGNIKDALKLYFPDYEIRFIKPVESDFEPGDRFPNFENKTRLYPYEY